MPSLPRSRSRSALLSTRSGCYDEAGRGRTGKVRRGGYFPGLPVDDAGEDQVVTYEVSRRTTSNSGPRRLPPGRAASSALARSTTYDQVNACSCLTLIRSRGGEPSPGSDNQYSVNKRPDRTQACPRPRRAAERVISPALWSPANFDVLRPLPPRHATPLSRVVQAVRPSDFGLNPRITVVLEHERRMRGAEGGLYPWCRATAPSSTSVEYRWSRHGPGPPPALRAVGGRGLLCFRTKPPPSPSDDTQEPLLSASSSRRASSSVMSAGHP